MFYFIYFSDTNFIVVTEHDIDDPHVHVDIENIRTYSMGLSRIDFFIEVTPSKVLQIWGILKWKSFSTLNKGQNKNYMTQLQTTNACQKKREWWEWTWKKILWKDMPNMPKDFEYDLTNLHSVVSWSKSLDGLPQFSVENIKKICKHGNSRSVVKVCSCKKAFQSWRAIDRVTKCWHWVNFHQAARWFLLFQRWLWG